MGKVLVIRGGAIGDFLLTLPAVKLLRDNLPDAWIEVLGYDAMVELARDAGIVHDGRSIEYAALARFFTPGAELDEGWVEYFASFDLIVSYLYDPDRFFLNNLLRCGVKEDNILQGVAKVVSDTEHAAIQLARAMESIALFLDRPAVDLDLEPAHGMAADRFLRDAGAPANFIALHPGSGSPKKNWPLDNWIELGAALRDANPDASLLLVSGEAETGNLAPLTSAWKRQNIPFSHANSLPLPVLSVLLRRASLFIGHDSGISHLAAASGPPCLLLFGPTEPGVWAPRNPKVTVLRAPDGNLNHLEADQVLETALTASTRSDDNGA